MSFGKESTELGGVAQVWDRVINGKQVKCWSLSLYLCREQRLTDIISIFLSSADIVDFFPAIFLINITCLTMPKPESNVNIWILLRKLKKIKIGKTFSSSRPKRTTTIPNWAHASQNSICVKLNATNSDEIWTQFTFLAALPHLYLKNK